LAQQLLAAHLKPGDSAIDATAGQGQDTSFLARLVGEKGQVWAFDIQEEACRRTKQRLTEAGLWQQVQIIHADHQFLADYVPGFVQAAVFNLGYLPGGDQQIITRPHSTLKAVRAALATLAPGGLLTIVAYPGHAGGLKEYLSLQQELSALPPGFQVEETRLLNKKNGPVLLATQKEK
jgi:predicted methyltransferase